MGLHFFNIAYAVIMSHNFFVTGDGKEVCLCLGIILQIKS